MSEILIKSVPQELALIYVKSRENLTNLSPEEIYKLYADSYDTFYHCYQEHRKQKKNQYPLND